MNAWIGRVVGNYRILEQIGQGGMSSVFRAVGLTTGRMVAIKILSPTVAHEELFRARFEREIRVLRRLQHPNIVPILDFGESEDLSFIVMPYFDTGTLQERLRRGPLKAREAARIVDQVASGLAFAHESGIVHRDVKPSNVLIDENGNALLSDFSFARSQETSQNLTGSALIGTPAYMSPEQCRGGPIDARSDQYSFAVMLFQIATGQVPFEGETPMAVAMKHASVPLPLPRSINPKLPPGIELTLIKALAKDPAQRFASVRELNHAFQSALRAALAPGGKAPNAATLSRERTLELYRRYQGVPGGSRRRRSYDRAAVLAALLLILACTVSAGTIAVIYPDIFWPADAARSDLVAGVDLQATVDVVLAANAAAMGNSVPHDVLQTRVYQAVLETLQATLTPHRAVAFSPPTVTGDEPTLPATLVFPTSVPTSTLTPTRSPTPSMSPTLDGSATATGIGATPTATPNPSSTAAAPTSTSPADTATAPPPTSPSPPPTATLLLSTNTAAPTNTAALACDWALGSPSVFEDEVWVRVYNNGDLPVVVTNVSITWTGSDDLRHIHWRYEGDFWSGDVDGPGTVSAGTSKTVPPPPANPAYRTVIFEFSGSSFSGSASVDVEADC